MGRMCDVGKGGEGDSSKDSKLQITALSACDGRGATAH